MKPTAKFSTFEFALDTIDFHVRSGHVAVAARRWRGALLSVALARRVLVVAERLHRDLSRATNGSYTR